LCPGERGGSKGVFGKNKNKTPYETEKKGMQKMTTHQMRELTELNVDYELWGGGGFLENRWQGIFKRKKEKQENDGKSPEDSRITCPHLVWGTRPRIKKGRKECLGEKGLRKKSQKKKWEILTSKGGGKFFGL